MIETKTNIITDNVNCNIKKKKKKMRERRQETSTTIKTCMFSHLLWVACNCQPSQTSRLQPEKKKEVRIYW